MRAHARKWKIAQLAARTVAAVVLIYAAQRWPAVDRTSWDVVRDELASLLTVLICGVFDLYADYRQDRHKVPAPTGKLFIDDKHD